MSSAVEDSRRAQQVTAARKKLKQFRATKNTSTTSQASRSSVSSNSTQVLSSSALENTSPGSLPRRLPGLKMEDDQGPMPKLAHARRGSHRRQQSSMSWPPLGQSTRPSVMGVFDLPPLEHQDDESSDHLPREIVTTPATPPESVAALVDENESLAIERLSSFSFGAKASNPLLPALPLRNSPPSTNSFPQRGKPPLSVDLASGLRDSISLSEATSPRRKRHSHNRSASISLPNIKLGRPTSLGVSSPNLPSTPSSPLVSDPNARSRTSTPQSSARLRFEPSEKEKEESRRRALDKLTGRQEHKQNEIVLPSFDDDCDEESSSSSRPPSDAITSTASSSRPSSFTFPSGPSSRPSSFTFPVASTSRPSSLTLPSTSFSSTSPPWAGFEDSERWSFGQRFDPKEDAPCFGLFDNNNKTSSVLLNSNLGVLAEEDETESEVADDMRSTSSVADHEDEPGPTPSRLRELHLVSSQSSSRRNSNPEAMQSFRSAARETPTKGYGSIGRGRPRPLALDASAPAFASSPSKARPTSWNSLVNRPVSRSSSISYKRDDSGSGSSRDYSSRGAMSPPSVKSDLMSPPPSTMSLGDWAGMSRPVTRPCPRPRSAVMGLGAGRVLGEVEEEEDPDAQRFDDGMSTGRGSTELSRDSFDGWSRRDSRDRIDAEMERDALREDVDLWRKRCRGLEERLEAERREAAVLRDRVRKLGDRLLAVSTTAAPQTEEDAQNRLILEMRDQLFSLTSALEKERKEKTEALARVSELQALDGAKTPVVSAPNLPSLPSTPKVRGAFNMPSTPPEAMYADADYADADEPDPNFRRMRGWGFPQGRVEKEEKESKRESFFGLSRPRAVRPVRDSASGLGEAWHVASPIEAGFDLPPIEVNDEVAHLVRPVSALRLASPSSFARREHHENPQPPAAALSTPTKAPHLTQPQPIPRDRHATPERQITSPPSAFSFLSGYLRGTPPPIPKITVIPSSMSPKRAPIRLERRGYDVDFCHSCAECEGEVIEL